MAAVEVPWQAFVRSNQATLNQLRTLPGVVQVGSLLLTPSGLVRREPNKDVIPPELDFGTEWSVSTPISVEGVTDGSGGSHYPGPTARRAIWRLCALLALEWGQAWMPLAGPWNHFVVGQRESSRVDPHDWRRLSRPQCFEPAQEAAPTTAFVELSAWFAPALDCVERDDRLEQIDRTFLNGLRSLERGHLESEAAVLLLVAALDGIGHRLCPTGGSSDRVMSAIRRSFELRPCAGCDPDSAAAELHRLLYKEHRCKVTHEAVLPPLVGCRSGPLGDKPTDFDPMLNALPTHTVSLLAEQTRVVLRAMHCGS